MKIYFEDGKLWDYAISPDAAVEYKIDASQGVSACIRLLDICAECRPSSIIYTNSIFALHNMYAWNDELSVPEIYIKTGKAREWVRIDKLTSRELKQGHNLAKMYVAGEFEKKRSEYSES
jgi:hypothetical protein